ncbi:MAG: ATP-grasp domain-containing protein [Candidatus Cloacimonetes bacterium]|nr:ATP-grasp domain-containing protein [Candidatus Cloacimonadota bacterium]
MNYIITGNTYNSKFIEELAKRDDIIAMSGEELENSNIYFAPLDKVYVPSETSLSIVMDRMQDKSYVNGINKLKNKYFCREALSSIYPDFYFAKAALADIPSLKFGDKKVVIKPLKGFFGTGVRIADKDTDLHKLAYEMNLEVESSVKFFPESILSKDEYIIEEFITGDEYAVDMFFDEQGKPAIMNIYFHPEPIIPEYFHLMYYTNKEIFDLYLDTFNRFFTELNGVLNLKNFPIHAEFKLQDGVMVPIELNPMRYGGFGLADLTFNSYNFQPITAYFDDKPVDWYAIWKHRKQYNYAWILGYNGKDVNMETKEPNHEKFVQLLGVNNEIMDYVHLNHKTNPVFALAYLRNNNIILLKELLGTEFNDFFA